MAKKMLKKLDLLLVSQHLELKRAMTAENLEDALRAFDSGEWNVAEDRFLGLLNSDLTTNFKTEKVIDIQEISMLKLGEVYKQLNDPVKLKALLESSRKLISGPFPKSKAAKVIKSLLDTYEEISTDLSETIEITKECVQWSIDQNRAFLRQYLEIKLSSFYYKQCHYPDSIKIINKLLKEFKKLDDKSSLVEVQLLESKNYFELKNYAKSKASLTSARTSANSIYCPSNVQAELDLMSGILNAQDSDFDTSFSYFYESFENYQLQKNIDEVSSIKVLKYMLLCKVMLGKIDELKLILKQKNVQKFINKRDIEAMDQVSNSYNDRSLKQLEDCLKQYNTELTLDPIIRFHLRDLYDTLFQKNLLKLIEPYSTIEIQHICSIIGLPKDVIENKLSNMILDGIISGVIDQGNGWLIIYDELKDDKTYELGLDVIKNMTDVVNSLYEKASVLN